MKRILIIEDEQYCSSRMRRMLQEIDNTWIIEGPLSSVEEVVDTLHRFNGYDIIFSDIMLGNVLVFEAFREIMPNAPVVFITAYNEYALEAFQANGIAYLLKPFQATDLIKAIDKVSLSHDTEQETSKLNEAGKQLKCYRERFLVCKGGEYIPLHVSKILFIRKEEDGVFAYTVQGEHYKLDFTMKDIEEQLSPEIFFRLNRQYIAHINSIQKLSPFFGDRLSVKITGCNESVTVSKETSSELKNRLNR